MSRIQLIYVAGPYTAPTVHETLDNIYLAWRMGTAVAAMGHMPVIPHTNTALMDAIQDQKFFIEGTLQLMRRCDAVLMLPGWEQSKGALGEEHEAIHLKMPVFYNPEDLEKWLKTKDD